MTENTQPIIEKVLELYKSRAEFHGDENAVLDGSLTNENKHTNIIIDYLTRRALIEYLKPKIDDVIIDFGCGVGRLTFILSSKVKKIYGLDITPELLEIARNSKKNKNSNNIEFVQLDPKKINLPEIKFDKIFFVGTLFHISDEILELILPQIYNGLNPEGKIILIEYLTQYKSIAKEDEVIVRSYDHIKIIFERHGFEISFFKPAIRMPSYSISLWKKINSHFRFILPILYMVEKLTLFRKTEFVDYYFYAVELKKSI